jgi:predicted transcriptional regulator
MENSILEHYEQLKELLGSVETNIRKNVAGNKSAGVRARKVLRQLKKDISELVKETIEAEK